MDIFWNHTFGAVLCCVCGQMETKFLGDVKLEWTGLSQKKKKKSKTLPVMIQKEVRIE